MASENLELLNERGLLVWLRRRLHALGGEMEPRIRMEEALMLLAKQIGAPLAVDYSPSETPILSGDERSASTCGSTEDAVECARSITGKHKWGFCSFCFAEKPILAAPRKVWAIMWNDRLSALYSSELAANQHLAKLNYPPDYTISEYEISTS